MIFVPMLEIENAIKNTNDYDDYENCPSLDFLNMNYSDDYDEDYAFAIFMGTN